MIFSPAKVIALLEKEIAENKFGNNPDELYEPLRYMMQLGGKRTRPFLTVLSYYIFSGKIEEAIRPATAIEVFHNFTLIHDDIMDNAPLRRGQKTVHEKWDNNTAILSGDVMLVKAYELLLDVDKENCTEVIRKFNKCAAEVCEGQQLDVMFEKRDDVKVEEYIKMISLKTAALVGFSLELGGMLANASQSDIQKIKEFGINVGIAFQLKDDLLDVFGDEEKFGKKVGGDIASNKKTFLLIKAFEKANDKEKKNLKELLSSKNEAEKIKQVTELYKKLDIKKTTEEEIEHYFNKALKNLSSVNADLMKKRLLKDFANQLMNRDK